MVTKSPLKCDGESCGLPGPCVNCLRRMAGEREITEHHERHALADALILAEIDLLAKLGLMRLGRRTIAAMKRDYFGGPLDWLRQEVERVNALREGGVK